MQYPRASEERVPLSSHHGAASTLSTGLLVDTNLDTSVPDAYTPPPPPMPFDVALGRSQTPQRAQGASCDKDVGAVQTTSDSVQETTGMDSRGTPAKCEDIKVSSGKEHINLVLDSAKEPEIEPPNSVEPVVSATEEDVCPICLEGNAIIIFFHSL